MEEACLLRAPIGGKRPMFGSSHKGASAASFWAKVAAAAAASAAATARDAASSPSASNLSVSEEVWGPGGMFDENFAERG